MAVPQGLALEARRNAPYTKAWSFTTDGSAVDFTGASISMQVRLYGAQAGDPLISLTDGVAAGVEGLTADDGIVEVLIEESSLLFLPQGKPGETMRFQYDLKVQLSGQFEEVWAQGVFLLKPGVTDRLGLRTTDADEYRITDDGSYRVTG